MKIYFAAPLFSDAEKTFNQNLAAQPEEPGFDVFLPQREGVKKQGSLIQNTQRRKTMFNLDREQIFNSDSLNP